MMAQEREQRRLITLQNTLLIEKFIYNRYIIVIHWENSYWKQEILTMGIVISVAASVNGDREHH